MRRLPFSLACLAALWLLLGPTAAGASAPGASTMPATGSAIAASAFPALAQLHRTIYTTRDGVPATIWAMSQDRDGYLWLGGENGLYRFDGLQFERKFKGQLPPGVITALFGDAAGDVWVGYLDGTVMRIHGGVVQSGARTHPGGTVMSFHQARDGMVWMTTPSYVASWVDGAWRRAGAAEGFEGHRIGVTATGSDGSYWIFDREAAYRLGPDSVRFERYDKNAGLAALAGLPDTVTYPDGRLAADLIVDRYGALWVPERDRLTRLHADTSAGEPRLVVESVPPSGPGGDIQVTADYSDRNGNVWIATSTGLEKFRATRFTPLVLPAPVYRPTIVDSHDGALWVASQSGTPPMRVGNTITLHPELGSHTECIASSKAGDLWLAGDQGLRHYKDGVVTAMPIPVAPGKPVRPAASGVGCIGMGVNTDGSLWMSTTHAGVSRWDGKAWHQMERLSASAAQLSGSAVWMGFTKGRLVLLEQGKQTVYSKENGLDVGAVTGLFAGKSGLWILGTAGVTLKSGDRFQQIVGERGERFENAADLVQLDDGDVWMLSAHGVYHIPAREVQSALATPGHAVSYTTFDQADGLQGALGSLQAEPLEVGDDGRIWVASELGVAWIDPHHVRPAPPAPPVSIESLNERDVRPADASPPRLEKGTRNVAITYTAATLSAPSRTHFRYLMKGIDSDWQDAGQQREARYSNLGPGNYTFAVEAANSDGIWTGKSTELHFEIEPALYQTWWFKGLCAAAALLVVWLLYLLRVAHICAQLNARSRERESMARDFHDTILQSFQSLLLHVDIAVQSVPEHAAREKLDKALSATSDALIEGREKIGQLRSLAEPLEALPTDISKLAALFGNLHPMAFSMHVEGPLRPLRSPAASDVHAIARELVINAFRHSQASSLHVELQYGRLDLTIVVTDDGCGIDPSAFGAREPGHWGLQGMQERAKMIGGRLTIVRAQSGSGTCATLKIPARFIYAPRRWFR